MLGYLYRPLGIFFLLLMIIMGIQVAVKKPLCINSNTVYKIDKIRERSTETIYSCRQLKEASFSNFFYEHVKDLEARFISLEVVLGQLDLLNIKGGFTVIIDDLNKNQTQELGNGIQISIDLLSTKQLEKVLLQLSIKNKLKNKVNINANHVNIPDDIFLQTLSDFFIADGTYQNLVSQAWGETFKELNFFEKKRLTQDLMQNISPSNKLFAVTNPVLNSWNDQSVNQPTNRSISLLKALASTLASPTALDNFDKNLKKLGFYTFNELAESKLDIIIQDTMADNIELISLAKKHTNLKIAVHNASGVFLLPSFLKIPEALEHKIFTRYRFIFANKLNIAHYIDNTESLILLRPVENLLKKPHKLDLKSLFLSKISFGANSGIGSRVGAFLSQNKQMDFIQIHLPSYRLKSKDLDLITNYFEFVGLKTLSKIEHKTLGWTRTEWLKDLQAFKPIANYEVIQYFRVGVN